MKTQRLLFLGASKRVSLLERFIDAAQSLNLKLEIFSCEIADDFYPISHLVTILAGPRFLDSEFQDWLAQVIKERSVDIIIPTMDAATVALSKFARSWPELASRCWVSDYRLCEAMNDKLLSDQFFSKHDWPTPTNTPGFFPKVAKPKLGFGAKGIVRLSSHVDHVSFQAHPNIENFLVQDWLPGEETSVDFYVSPARGLVGYVLRDRLEVSDGEVMVCVTRPASKEEAQLIEIIGHTPGWKGCITLQYLRTPVGLRVIEINPRFGGGATCSIEAGLNMPHYLLAEATGQPFSAPKYLKTLKMTRARRDFFQELA